MLAFSRVESRPDKWIFRKLESILRDLEPLVAQGKVEGYFNHVKNVDKLGGLVGDIHDGVVAYQVCTYELLFIPAPLTFALDFITTRYLRQELSAHRESSPPTFYLSGVTAQ